MSSHIMLAKFILDAAIFACEDVPYQGCFSCDSNFICTISTAEVPYSRYILAPSKRVLSPQKVYGVSGTVDHAEALLDNHSGEATFGSNSSVTYDFGQNTAGLISFAISSVSDNNQWIGLSFSESNIWISPNGSDATQNVAIDETLWFQVESGNYSVEREHNRGGFRYLNVYHNTTGSVTLQNVTLYFTPMPHYADNSIGNYSGYYHCDDEKLNRVWYSAAYTNQLCTIPSDLGNHWWTIQQQTLRFRLFGGPIVP